MYFSSSFRCVNKCIHLFLVVSVGRYILAMIKKNTPSLQYLENTWKLVFCCHVVDILQFYFHGFDSAGLEMSVTASLQIKGCCALISLPVSPQRMNPPAILNRTRASCPSPELNYVGCVVAPATKPAPAATL